MSINSTQRYLDNERQETFLSSLLPTDIQSQSPIVPIPEEIDIDVDIEKQISLLQEASIAGKLESKPNLSINPDKQIKEWQLEKEFAGFLDSVGKEKEDTSKKIEEEQEKISALENLFDDLMAAKSGKKKKKLLLEPEKVEPIEEITKVILREPPKPVPGLTKEQIADKYVNLPKEEVYIDENARRIVAEKYSELGNATLHSFLSPEEVKSDPDIINKVMSHINEMQVANELEKEKMTGLKSIDTLDKLTREFLNFKHITSLQMGTIGGGGLNPEAVDSDLIPIKTNTFNLGRADRTFKDLYLSGASLVIGGTTMDSGELTVLDSVTAGTVAASKAVVVDSNKDITGFRNVTIAGDLTVSGTTTTIDSTTIEIQNSFVFEGATADAHETTLTTVDPTADRTISLPNATGTIVLQDSTDTLTNKTLTNPTINGGTFSGTLTGTANLTGIVLSGGSPLVFEGATADAHETTLAFVDPTADKTVYMPNATGYVPVLNAASTTVITATPAELNYVDGVTSNIQTQLATKSTKAFAIAQAVALG